MTTEWLQQFREWLRRKSRVLPFTEEYVYRRKCAAESVFLAGEAIRDRESPDASRPAVDAKVATCMLLAAEAGFYDEEHDT